MAIFATKLQLNSCRFKIIQGTLTYNVLIVRYLRLLYTRLLTIFQVSWFMPHIALKEGPGIPRNELDNYGSS